LKSNITASYCYILGFLVRVLPLRDSVGVCLPHCSPKDLTDSRVSNEDHSLISETGMYVFVLIAVHHAFFRLPALKVVSDPIAKRKQGITLRRLRICPIVDVDGGENHVQ
jgi:hypothetical protein